MFILKSIAPQKLSGQYLYREIIDNILIENDVKWNETVKIRLTLKTPIFDV